MKERLLVKTRDLIRRESSPSFEREIDLYAVEEDILIGVTGALGKGFRLEGRDLLLQSEADIRHFEAGMRKFLNTLPEGAALHFIVRSREGDEEALSAYQASVGVPGDLTRRLTETKIDAYRQHPFLNREVFLFVVLHPEGNKPPSSFMSLDVSLAFGKAARRLSALHYGRSTEALRSMAEEVREGLLELGFRLAPLRDGEILRYLYELLNPGYARSAPFEEARFLRAGDGLDPSSLRSRLLMTPPRVAYEHFYLSGFFHSVLNLAELPETTDLKIMKDFEGGLGKDYLLTLTLEIPDQTKERAGIKRQGNLAIAKNFYSRSKDHEAIKKASETDALLAEIAETGDRLFYVTLAVLVKDERPDDLSRRSREVLKVFPRLGDARGIEDHMNHDRLFLSFLPLQGDENPLAFLVRSRMLTHLLPLQASWRGTDKMGLLLKTYRDEPLKLDLFDPKLQAKHALMLGATGSGKSFFTNHLLLHFLIESLEHEVIVIDLGGSYRKIASVLGGAYLEVECAEAYALNPFPRKGVLFPDKHAPDPTFIQFLKELLQKMIASDRLWPSSEKMILERAICEVYAKLNDSETPLLGDLGACLRDFTAGDEEDRRKAYRFAKELSLFTEGEYGKLLNHKGVFDFDNRFTVFDLRRISHYPELQEILLLIIPFALKRKFQNLKIKKLLVLDECWQLLKEAQGTDLVEVFYRTARKLNAGVLSISQNPEDFLGSRIAGVMVNNSPVKYILRLKKGHERLCDFGFNPNEIKAAEELELKQGSHAEIFIKFDEHAVIGKLEPSPLEYWIATTDAADLAEERRLKEAYGTLSDLEILEKLARRFPCGVKHGRVFEDREHLRKAIPIV